MRRIIHASMLTPALHQKAPPMESPNASNSVGELTVLIDRIERGDAQAQAEFCQRVYDELRAVAHRLCGRLRVDALETTDVVQDLFGQWLRDGRLCEMKNRRYFYAAAADQMRRILIDHLRRNATQAAGGRMKRADLDAAIDALIQSTSSQCGGDLEMMNAALDRLKEQSPRAYEIVRMKFYAGMTIEQIAETLGVSVDIVKRQWKQARERLKLDLNRQF
jgi:RNA polymerase sigma factor (TIGR02999 family)